MTKRKKNRRESSSDESTSSSGRSSCNSRSSSSKSDRRKKHDNKRAKHKRKTGESATKSYEKQINPNLLKKLRARGETLEEREARRKERRAAKIAAQFGYTAEENPFHDPNIADTFTWKKKIEKQTQQKRDTIEPTSKAIQQDSIFHEIHKVRMRREAAEQRKEELERIKMEESKLQQYEQYDAWAQKEELFHLQQAKLKSATRLVQRREKPIDVLAKNLLLFELSSSSSKDGQISTTETSESSSSISSSLIKYKEKYNVMEELDSTLDAELEEPYLLLKHLRLDELEQLMEDIVAFQSLERHSLSADGKVEDNMIVRYWDALAVVAQNEINSIQNDTVIVNDAAPTSSIIENIQNMFEGQSKPALEKMKRDIQTKLQRADSHSEGKDTVTDLNSNGFLDVEYWTLVLQQLRVYLAKMELSEIHERMLVCQLEKLEKRKDELEKKQEEAHVEGATEDGQRLSTYTMRRERQETDDLADRKSVDNLLSPKGLDPEFGSLEEELGLTDEVDLSQFFRQEYAWQDRYRPRKPRYFNRVKTGYDWNKYNQTHYDHDNPPPKTVQGYKFNIFYTDLIDKTKTPQFFLEPADTPEYCIIRFHAGPPYEDVAFKIINQEWNRSRKRGYRCCFERGVLSLYFNFKSHWYRR